MKACKQDLINKVAEATNETKADVKRILDSAFYSIEVLAQEEGISIHGFGTFKYKTRAARTCRDPRTQQPVEVPEKTSLTFSATKRG
jgi:nucleoid DNA-binding protein